MGSTARHRLIRDRASPHLTEANWRETRQSNLATKADLATLEGRLKTDLAALEVRLLKWGVGIAFATAGLLFAALRLVG